MKTVTEEKLGAATIRIVKNGTGYRGAIIYRGRVGTTIDDSDHQRLHARLRNEACKTHPDYFGMDGAIARFLHFFPNGFDDHAFDVDERQYKESARRKLLQVLPLERAEAASPADAVAVRPAFNTNILSQFELARTHALLGSPQGADFVRAAACFTNGDWSGGLAGMVAAIAPHGRHSWPMMTYLPNLWQPSEHMFLKPNATVDFAQRIGHRFQFDYSAEPIASVYESLLNLVEMTEAAIVTLEPRSRIDVQSFIWVVGDYTEAELPRLETLRAT